MPRNSMDVEWSTASQRFGTLMRHFLSTCAFAAPVAIAPLALGVTVPAASRLLITTPGRAQ